jgi:hypothetical protein
MALDEIEVNYMVVNKIEVNDILCDKIADLKNNI